ncbi:MAG: hypothetical protein NT159_11035 [Proteobacteria bacterium]|nr:hypothetical protein [Pseudomonadota bacterium]
MTVALLFLADAGRAAEIAPYMLTGVDGYATLQYLQDEQITGQPGTIPQSRQAQSGFRNEIFAMTHSYVYHPNLLLLDIGGGPVLHSESFTNDTDVTKARGALYNFTARAMFLRDKPYTGALFYSHLNPIVSVAPGQVLTQENTRYGFDFSLLTDASPVPLQTGFTRSHVQGHSADRLVDERIDQFNLTASRSYGAMGATQLQYQTMGQISQSGSQNLPIQSSTSYNQTVYADTRLQIGDSRQYDLANVVSFNRQDYALESGSFPERKDRRFMLDLRARHSDKLRSYGFYNYGASSQGDLDSVMRAASAGLSYLPLPGLETSLGVRGDSNAGRQFSAQSHGIDGSVRYEQPLLFGIAQISYAVRADSRGQQAESTQTSVLGERLALSSVTYVALAHPYVIAGTPVVTNAGRTQTFVAGVDYLITLVGTETRLQRLVGGRILDGEQLLVDYAYDIGGTYAYNQFDQSLSLNWNLSRYLNANFRRYASVPRLTTGLPTFPLNAVNSSIYGLRTDLPFNLGTALTIGGGIEHENRHETVSPYRRTADDIYIQTDEPLLGLGNLRASLRRARIKYDVAAQNSDLHGRELRFWSRHWFGADLTAALSTERDAAGIIPRSRKDGSIGLQWQERKFTLTSNLVRSREIQAGIERNRTNFQFLAKRDF